MGLPAPEFLMWAEWTTPQCVVIAKTEFFHISAPLWLDSLYLRRRPALYFPYSFIRTFSSSVDTDKIAGLYATNITVQDNGARNSSVLDASFDSRALFEGEFHSVILLWNSCKQTLSLARLELLSHTLRDTFCL